MNIWVIVIAVMVLSFIIQQVLQSRFSKYSKVPNQLSGREVAEKMLRDNGITDVKVCSIGGMLTDHYDPSKKVINLSEGVYSQRTVAAAAVAARAGITEFYAEVLPEDKARFVARQKEQGRKVLMVGDGINDSPALSAADVGIAMKEGADIAQEIADVTIAGDALEQLVVLKKISDRLMPRMRSTARVGIAFNGAILLAGLLGLVTPGTAAFLHNASTIGLSLYNMTPLAPEEE